MINIKYKYHGSPNLWEMSFTHEERLKEWLEIFKPFISYRRSTEEPFKITIDNGMEFEQATVGERLDNLFKKVHTIEEQLREELGL